MAYICGNEIIFENGKRYYKESLLERRYDLENTTPFKIVINDVVIEETGWGELIRSITLYLLDNVKDAKEKLYNFRTDWSKQSFFTPMPISNSKKIFDDFYVNCNHTALHSCWLIGDVLKYLGIDLNSVSIFIHRTPFAEPKDVKEHFRLKFFENFKLFLSIQYSKTEEKSTKIIRVIDKHLNPMLKKLSKSYNDIFLFDDKYMYANYVTKIHMQIDDCLIYNQKEKSILHKYLDYLTEFYKMS